MIQSGKRKPRAASEDSGVYSSTMLDKMMAATERDNEVEEDIVSLNASNETSLRAYDVLTGRGTGPNQSLGNTRFRKIIRKTYQEYQESFSTHSHKSSSPYADTMSGCMKQLAASDPLVVRRPMDASVRNLLAQQVFDKILARNGRFLRRICLEDYRNLPESQRARVVRVPVAADTGMANIKGGKAGSDHAASKTADFSNEDACTSKTCSRTNLYVELSTKETLEKIKQSLRFQIERGAHLEREKQQQQYFREVERTSSKATPMQQQFLQSSQYRKRAAEEQARLPTITVKMTSDWNSALLPPWKKRAAALVQSDQSLVGMGSNMGNVDCFLWPRSSQQAETSPSILTSGSLHEGITSTQQAQQYQQELLERQQLPRLIDTLPTLYMRANSSHSHFCPTLSTDFDIARLGALSRINAESIARIRHQEKLSILSSVLDRQEHGFSISDGRSNETGLLTSPPSLNTRAFLTPMAVDSYRRLGASIYGLTASAANERFDNCALGQAWRRTIASSQHDVITPALPPSLYSGVVRRSSPFREGPSGTR
jgi:hypothetical protein